MTSLGREPVAVSACVATFKPEAVSACVPVIAPEAECQRLFDRRFLRCFPLLDRLAKFLCGVELGAPRLAVLHIIAGAEGVELHAPREGHRTVVTENGGECGIARLRDRFTRFEPRDFRHQRLQRLDLRPPRITAHDVIGGGVSLCLNESSKSDRPQRAQDGGEGGEAEFGGCEVVRVSLWAEISKDEFTSGRKCCLHAIVG